MSLHAKYTEEQRATALCFYDACGRNLREAARKADVPHTTLDRWVKGGATNAAVSAKRDALKGELADIFERLARESLALAFEKMQEASYLQLATGAAIGADKMRLLRDQPTTVDSQRTIRIEYADAPTPEAAPRPIEGPG